MRLEIEHIVYRDGDARLNGFLAIEMRLIGCDLHASQQSIAMLDRDTGVVVEKTLMHEGGAVREFYAATVAGFFMSRARSAILRSSLKIAQLCYPRIYDQSSRPSDYRPNRVCQPPNGVVFMRANLKCARQVRPPLAPHIPPSNRPSLPLTMTIPPVGRSPSRQN
jgi:hypothetical protein